jgi:hypothetical protein
LRFAVCLLLNNLVAAKVADSAVDSAATEVLVEVDSAESVLVHVPARTRKNLKDKTK